MIGSCMTDGISIDATVCHGKPVISGTRVLVSTILGALAGGDSVAVVALKKPARAAILERLAWLLDHLPHESISHRAFQLRDQAWQVYPPLG
jgi:uncharacterized protein (DUF433 family)